MIVSEFWIQRDMIPMDFVTMDVGKVRFDSFECVEQGERFQMRAALRSRALQYISDCVQFPQLVKVLDVAVKKTHRSKTRVSRYR